MSDVKVGDKVDTYHDQIALTDKGGRWAQYAALHHGGEHLKLVADNLEEDSQPPIESPTINSEPFMTIKGVEVGSSLERALNLVVAVYNGDSLRCNEYGYTPIVRYFEWAISAVVRVIEDKGPDWCTLKSEEEAKLNKETLDKEIQELENKLQELKTKRGGLT